MPCGEDVPPSSESMCPQGLSSSASTYLPGAPVACVRDTVGAACDSEVVMVLTCSGSADGIFHLRTVGK